MRALAEAWLPYGILCRTPVHYRKNYMSMRSFYDNRNLEAFNMLECL